MAENLIYNKAHFTVSHFSGMTKADFEKEYKDHGFDLNEAWDLIQAELNETKPAKKNVSKASR